MFLKELCHSTAFCFASKSTDTDRSQEKKWILSMWGKVSTMTIIQCNYIYKHINWVSELQHTLKFSSYYLRNERTCPFTSKLDTWHDGSERTVQRKNQSLLPSAGTDTAIQNAGCKSLFIGIQEKHCLLWISWQREKTKLLANRPLYRSREHVPESSSVSLRYFSASLAFLTNPDHNDRNNTT